MALTGQLSDLSLAELIEFFCNQRKTGRLKVIYPEAPGYFYIQAGSLVDARIGSLNGVEAVYYALTLPNASFKFSPVFEATRRTIHQPWSQVVLEGLRRIDEGITQKAFHPETGDTQETDAELDEITESEVENLAAFRACEEADANSAPMPFMVQHAADGGSRKRTLLIVAAVIALAASVAVVGVPAGWYGKAKPQAAAPVAPPASTTSAPATTEAAKESADEGSSAAQSEPEESKESASAPANVNNEAILAARREREARDRERMLRLAEERANAASAKQPENASSQAQANSTSAVKKPEAPRTGPKMVSVQVTYDEAGRVTQASGGDAAALRIARQKRFPAGKAGSTTVTIPMN